jgi:hypothetical protein
MFFSAILSVLGLGFLCWVMFNLAVYALPVFVAISAGKFALASGASPIGATLTGLFAGACAMVLGQIAFAAIRSQPIRLALGAPYALPAGLAGFHAVRGLSEIGGAGETWTLVFASIGAASIGGAAWLRVASLAEPDDGTPPPNATRGSAASHRQPQRASS